MALAVVQANSSSLGSSFNPQATRSTSSFQPASSPQSLQPTVSAQYLQPTVTPTTGQSFGSSSTSSPSTTSNNTSSTVSSGPTAAQIAAQQAAAAKAAQLATDAKLQQDSMNTTIGQFGTGTADSAANNIQTGVQGDIAALQGSQQNVNNSVSNAELNRQLGIRDLVNTIRAGLASGAISLGNSNGLDSSAAEEMARAYGMYGNNQQNDINANANSALQEAAQAQQGVNNQKLVDQSSLESQKTNTLAQIQNSLGLYLKMLDDQGQSEGLGPLNYLTPINQNLASDNSLMQNNINALGTDLQAPVFTPLSPTQAAANALHAYSQNALPTNLSGYSFNTQPTAPSTTNLNTAPTVQLPLYTNKYVAG